MTGQLQTKFWHFIQYLVRQQYKAFYLQVTQNYLAYFYDQFLYFDHSNCK